MNITMKQLSTFENLDITSTDKPAYFEASDTSFGQSDHIAVIQSKADPAEFIKALDSALTDHYAAITSDTVTSLVFDKHRVVLRFTVEFDGGDTREIELTKTYVY